MCAPYAHAQNLDHSMCDTIAAFRSSTSTGAVLFGKNSDRDYLEAQYLQSVPAARHAAGVRVRLTYKEIEQARETHAALLSKPHWIWGAEMGANEHGLVIGNEAIFAKIEASMTEGIIGMDYVRLGLERAKDVDEAIHVITTLLREHGQGGNCGFRRAIAYHNSFMLADFRQVKVLETVDRDWVVTSVADYYAISNSMTIESDVEASSATLRSRAIEAGLHRSDAPFSFKSVFEDETKTAGSHHRRNRAMKLLGERRGRLQPADFFGVLRDHEEAQAVDGRAGARICAHRRENPIGQTTGSWVADLTPNKVVHWVTGTAAPCTGLFKPLVFATGLPDHGPKPGAEEDTVSLWWRHEQLRRSLDECSDDLRCAFTEERNDLEARFVEEMKTCPTVTDEKDRDEIRRIVRACWRIALAFEARWYDRLLS
jgi:secernin